GHFDVGAFQSQENPLLVTTASDPGSLSGLLSLREAVNLANAYANAGDSARITFASGVSRILLAGSQLELSGTNATTAATITIAGGGRVTVDGNSASRVFQVDAAVQAVFANLTITNGNADSSPFGGGGIYTNFGTVTVSGSTLSGNHADNSGDGGGGIFTNG